LIKPTNGLDLLEDAFEWLIEHGYAVGGADYITLTEKFYELLF